MSADNNKAVVRGYIETVWNKRRLDLLDKYMSEDVVHHDAPGLDDRESIRNFITTFQNAFPDWKIDIDSEIAEGDLVVLRETMGGTQKNEFMGMPASGKHCSVPGIYQFRVSDGKIAELWGLSDSMSMMQQLGAIPATASG